MYKKWNILYRDQAIKQFWKQLASIIALKYWHVNQSVQHD